MEPRCRQCGYCCKNLKAHYLAVPEADVRRWKELGRDDILKWIVKIEVRGEVLDYDIWRDPNTGEDIDGCPWLNRDAESGRYFCAIHDVKPSVCREYPDSMERAFEDGCKAYERE